MSVTTTIKQDQLTHQHYNYSVCTTVAELPTAGLHLRDLAYGDEVGVGEVNTISNIGTDGVGVYKQKVGTKFNLKKLRRGRLGLQLQMTRPIILLV